VPGIPELVAKLHILLHALIAPGAIGHPDAIRVPLAFRVGTDDVPGDPAAREMIEAREPPHHRIGMLECGRERHADADVTGRRRQDRNEGRRLVDGTLDGVFDRSVRAAFVIVIRSEFVGNEDRVEQAALHRPRHMLPIGGTAPVPVDLVLGMSPHAGGVTVDAVLDEAQQMGWFLRHRAALRRVFRKLRAPVRPPQRRSTSRTTTGPTLLLTASSAQSARSSPPGSRSRPMACRRSSSMSASCSRS
jgi:hypothetical protein